MDELHLIAADDRGGFLQPDVEIQPLGHDVAVLMPPGRRADLVGQRQQFLALSLVSDSVQVEQVGHIALAGGGAS
jgi:hypothetical protein